METYPKSMAHPWASRLRVSVVVGLVLALVFGALGVTPAKADTTTGLVLHWTFEEGSGTVTQDQTLNDLDGSIYWLRVLVEPGCSSRQFGSLDLFGRLQPLKTT